jgi:hypothetical protein
MSAAEKYAVTLESEAEFVPLRSAASVVNTDARGPAEDRFNLRSSPRIETEAATNLRQPLVSLRRPAPAQTTRRREGKTSVPAVVVRVNQVTVTFSCEVSTGYVEIDLPTDFVPEELAKYGASVFIDMAPDSEYRSLRVTARIPEPPASSAELEEIDSWIQSEL